MKGHVDSPPARGITSYMPPKREIDEDSRWRVGLIGCGRV